MTAPLPLDPAEANIGPASAGLAPPDSSGGPPTPSAGAPGQGPAGRDGARRRGDLTQGPILKTLLRFSVPTLAANLLQTLNGTINTVWVGRLLGESALAATANANIIMFLMSATVFGFGLATTVRVGQFYGARDVDSARRVFGLGLGFCVMVALTAAVLGWVFAPWLLEALRTPLASRGDALAYLRVTFVTVPIATLSMVVSQGLRGVGDSQLPLRAMILTVVLDVVLNPLLIRGIGPVPALGIGFRILPGLGIAGSALATGFANVVGVLTMFVVAYRQDNPLRLRGRELAYLIPRRGPERTYVLTKGIPMGAQILLVSGAGVLMVRLVNHEGLVAAAAYGASLQLWNYLQMPALAIGMAVSAMVAQNIGAGNHARVDRVTLMGLATVLSMTTAMAALIVLFSRPLLVLFLGSHAPAVGLAQHIQLICTWSFAMNGIMMILSGTMRAYGAVIAPLVVMFTSMYLARLGFYVLAYPRLGEEAVWWAFPAGSVVSVGLMVLAYRYGSWRNKRASAFVPRPVAD